MCLNALELDKEEPSKWNKSVLFGFQLGKKRLRYLFSVPSYLAHVCLYERKLI